MDVNRGVWPYLEGRHYNVEPFATDNQYAWNDRIKQFFTFHGDDVNQPTKIQRIVQEVLNIMGEDATPRGFSLEEGTSNTYYTECRFHRFIPDGAHIKSMDLYRMDNKNGNNHRITYQVTSSRILYLSGNPVMRIKSTLPELYVFNQDWLLLEIQRSENTESVQSKTGICISNHMLDSIPDQDPNTIHPRDFYLVVPLGNWTSRLQGTVERDEFNQIKRGESPNNRNVRRRTSRY